jgi:hypothetical protein
LLAGVLPAWAERDPEGAWNWFLSAEVDLVSAAKWLQTLGGDPEVDVAKREFAIAAQRRAPEAALSWANAINDAEKRLQTMRDVYSVWHYANPAQAERWLGAAGLQPETISAITHKR